MSATVDQNRVILTGENPFIRISGSENGANTTEASFWRVLFCPAGPGHVLYFRSELTDDAWRIYSDNIAMARWLQGTIQGSIDEGTQDTSIPVVEADFTKSGDPSYFWTENIFSATDDISMTWYGLGDPLLVHTQPDTTPGRPWGVCTVLIPAAEARLSVNGVQAAGRPWPRERDGRRFSTSALAFSESWTEAR